MRRTIFLSVLAGLCVWRAVDLRERRQSWRNLCGRLSGGDVLHVEAVLNFKKGWYLTEIIDLGGVGRLPGRISVGGASWHELPQVGAVVRAAGRAECLLEARNFSGAWSSTQLFREQPRLRFRGPVEVKHLHPPFGWWTWGGNIRRWLRREVAPWPKLQALVLGTWTGDWADLDAEFREFYQLGGGLHLLAVSGQHVLILGGLAQLVLCAAVRWMPVPVVWRAWGNYYLRLWVPVCSGAVLVVASWGAGSVVRAFALQLASLGLVLVGLRVSLWNRLWGATGILLLAHPSWTADLSWLLSLAATAALAAVGSGEPASRWRGKGTLLLAVVMPIALLPWSLYFWGRIALWAPAINFLLGLVWELVLIPFFFCFPLLHSVSGKFGRAAGDCAERLLHFWFQGHGQSLPLIEAGNIALVQLTLWESLAATVLLWGSWRLWLTRRKDGPF